MLLAHHTMSYLGIGIEVNGRPYPDGTIDHLLVVMAAVLLAYGIFAAVRDSLRYWWPRLKAIQRVRVRCSTGAKNGSAG